MLDTALSNLTQKYSQLVVIFFLTSLLAFIIIPQLFTFNINDIKNIFPICVMATLLYSVLSTPMFLILNKRVRNSNALRTFSWALFPLLLSILLLAAAYEAYLEEGNNELSYSIITLVVVQLGAIFYNLIRFNKENPSISATP
ncbi:MAG: hypothetical protein V4456_13385 [Bacteroidota bacterium]